MVHVVIVVAWSLSGPITSTQKYPRGRQSHATHRLGGWWCTWASGITIQLFPVYSRMLSCTNYSLIMLNISAGLLCMPAYQFNVSAQSTDRYRWLLVIVLFSTLETTSGQQRACYHMCCLECHLGRRGTINGRPHYSQAVHNWQIP